MVLDIKTDHLLLGIVTPGSRVFLPTIAQTESRPMFELYVNVLQRVVEVFEFGQRTPNLSSHRHVIRTRLLYLLHFVRVYLQKSYGNFPGRFHIGVQPGDARLAQRYVG